MKGTLLGFTWNNIHSSALGLVRISSGSEFSNELLPSFEDQTLSRPGSDGIFYYGSRYDKKEINITVAFNALTDAQIRAIKILFGEKIINNLTFDEDPYKMYRVKLASPPNMHYNIFTEHYTDMGGSNILHNHGLNTTYLPQARADDRVYKGTMDLQFIAYEPFAITRSVMDPTMALVKLKYSNQFENSAYVPEWKLDPNGSTAQSNIDWNAYNYKEWSDSVDFKPSNATITYSGMTYTIDTPITTGVAVYNPGDLSTPWNLLLLYGSYGRGVYNEFEINYIKTGSTSADHMRFTSFSLADDEIGFRINGKLQLVEGINGNFESTGRLYNRYLVNGHFFELDPIPETMQMLTFSFGQSTPSTHVPTFSIDYDYRFY